MYQAEGKQFCIFTTSTESYALTNFSENKRSLGQEPLEMNGYRSGEALLWCTVGFLGSFVFFLKTCVVFILQI